jgi:hypothetical protein
MIVHDMWFKYGRGHTAISDTSQYLPKLIMEKYKKLYPAAILLSKYLDPKIHSRNAIS